MMTFKDFQNWYCAKFQRNNPLPWQDGMQALLWYITEALPANTRATLSVTNAPTAVTITGDGTDASPYVWAFNLNRTEADDITAEKLFDIIKGSETIVVDISEDGTTLEVHLDADVIQKIDRALLTPVSPPAEPAAVVINTTGAQELKPLSEIGGGKLYRHDIYASKILDMEQAYIFVTIYKRDNVKFTLETLKAYLLNQATINTISRPIVVNSKYNLYQATDPITYEYTDKFKTYEIESGTQFIFENFEYISSIVSEV